MERRLQNSLWALGATLAVALLMGSLRPAQSATPHLASPGLDDPGVVATGSIDPDLAPAVLAVEVYQLLTGRAGWSVARYEEWGADVIDRMLDE